MIEYCNLTTDLIDAYQDIESYKNLSTLTGFELSSGSIYKLDQSGLAEMVFEDGEELTAASNASVSAGQFYYDAAADLLYLQCSDSANPSTHTIESGADWNVWKQRARNDAQEMLEGWLRQRYAVPFQKVQAPTQSYNDRDYDFWIRRATALLTCAQIVQRSNPDDPAFDVLYKQVYYPEPEIGDNPGIVQQILNGDIALRTQRVAREAGGWNIYEGDSNGANGGMIVTGTYTGSNREIWKITIDLGGAPGTATYKISYDNGTTDDKTGQATITSGADDRRVNIGGGLYAEFIGTLTLNDTWTIELWPSDEAVSASGFKSVRLER